MDEIAKKALIAYGFSVQSLGAPQKGYRNTSYKATVATDEIVNLIIYKAESEIIQRIQRLHDISSAAVKIGLPVRVPIDHRILRLSDGSQTRFAAIYNYLPGTTIAWEGYTKHHIKLLGATMGKLHTALTTQPQNDLQLVTDEQDTINIRMKDYFSQAGVQNAMARKLHVRPIQINIFQSFYTLLVACSKLPSQQPLHMDLVRGNILFDETKKAMYKIQDGSVAVSGIIDFEKTAFGHPVFDLARTYAFLLVDCKYKTEEKIYKYFFVSGYQKRGERPLPVITYKDKNVLHELTNFFLLHDFYKFLRHNPYEYLHQNKHYVRTRDILLARGLLETL